MDHRAKEHAMMSTRMSLRNYDLRFEFGTENTDAVGERSNNSAPDPPIREIGRSGIGGEHENNLAAGTSGFGFEDHVRLLQWVGGLMKEMA